MTRRDNADTIVELAVSRGDRVLELLGYRFRIVADLEVGDIAAVDRNIAAFTRLAEQLRQPLVSWYVPLFRGMRSLLAGDLDAADRHEREVAAAAEATGSHNAEMLAATLRLGHRRGAGPPHRSGRVRRALRRRSGRVGELRRRPGDGEAAWRRPGPRPGALEAACRQRLRPPRRGRRTAHDALMFGRVAVALDEPAAARARLRPACRPTPGCGPSTGSPPARWGPVDLELGRIALALGRPAEARAHLAQRP